VFTVTSINSNFTGGTTFTIHGSATDFVVLNVAASAATNNLNGSIVLAGGITSDHVLFNYTPNTSNLTTYNNDYASLSGGPTLNMSTGGRTTSGIFLDPTGNINIDNTTIAGRLFGGDSQDLAFVSGSELDAPSIIEVPEPRSTTLAVYGLLGVLVWGFRRRDLLRLKPAAL